jgi:hypothetical protein
MMLATVSFRIAPGKNAEAMAYLGQVTKHITGLTGTDYQTLTRVAGPVGHVVISTSYDSAADWDAARTKIAADPGFQKMVADAGAAGLFIAGSVEQALWHVS